MPTYAAVSDVQVRIPYRTISSSSTPSDTAVTAWLDRAEARVNGTLQRAGLPAPYSAQQAVRILADLVLDYAEGHVRMAYAATGGDGGNDDGKDLVKRFYDQLEDIIRDPTGWGTMLGAGSTPTSVVKIRSHVTDNADDKSVEDFAPVFKKTEVF